MALKNMRRVEPQWMPAERLGQLPMDPRLRPWLIGKGLLTQRLKSACGSRFDFRLVDQWSGLLSAVHKSALPSADAAGLFRDVEMRCGDEICVYAQTVMPDSTLCAHPWLAELGNAALGETLGALSNVERSAYEYRSLPVDDALSVRALRAAKLQPIGVWARRSRFFLRGAPLLIQELFLPAVGGV